MADNSIDTPSVVILCTNPACKDFETIIKELLNVGTLPDSTGGEAHFDMYPWHLETKYYSADVRLCYCTARNLGTEKFAQSVEALIIHCCEEGKDFEDLVSIESCLAFSKHWEPSVQLLVCNQVPKDVNLKMLQWCVKNEFEMVELNPDEEALEELEEYGEKHGIPRVIQVLRSHTWSNLIMKDEDSVLARLNPNTLLDSVAEVTLSPQPPTSSSVQEEVDNLLSLDSEQQLLAALNEGEDGDVSFEMLFEKFKDLKSRADSLPPEERKRYAEKVTLAFWKAIGGADEEIEGIDSDED